MAKENKNTTRKTDKTKPLLSLKEKRKAKAAKREENKNNRGRAL
ncbi:MULTISPECIES: hypothetical protein [unclassified Zunongwangia]|nr:hypothetical protein [Zunongwangia sp. HGR-M22]WBL24214.1 hypothetical protein PBT91_09760 [Zunongwangia sp. HGR-M22]